ncbi:MAG: ribonuclease HII [Bacteroidia bacterium]
MNKTVLKAFHQKILIEAGVDEAGRGCLAGPVVAAAVILPKKFKNGILNDSKKLSEKHRLELRQLIDREALAIGIGISSVSEIDEINILQASFLAMHRAISSLQIRPELLLIDGNRFLKFENVHHETIIGGDGIYLSIAAASVIAKTERDAIMSKYASEFPHYMWDKNKGYGTIAHRDAIREYGPCDLHRKSFKLLPD